ncbi:cobalamin biosynthesis protein CobG [Streptomyces sp. HU2014]|uniref:cobalamin biosynthesis protein CobG n=1 Tax=Streptomyces sp. HU2014 TaxID=2939414 RepID=UPI00200F27CE|nr:cobalamin biosynthesis protein CobG [Streptomyces sp. HU2014]UQI46793.1 cobalamin biosynthesis protein CobG [Streptomyces sp. HU2014]
MPSTPALSTDRDDSGAGAPAAGPVRERGDACPGALRLHAADDGALARVRLPGGLLTDRQAAVLARCAEELGDGHLDLTSRGNVQLRGLPAGCGGDLARELRAAGLLPSDRHDRIRNVVASPLCGLDGRHPDSGSGPDGDLPAAGSPSPDVQAWVRELDGLLCADDGPADLTGLSGRFLFGLDDGRGDIVALRPDVTLIASDGRAGLYFGTSGPGLRVLARDAPRAAVLAAAAFLAALESGGATAWRVRELPPGRRPTTALLADRLTAAGIAHTPLPDLRLPAGDPAGPGLVTGPDGLCALSVTAPLGRLTAAQWRLVTDVAAGEGAREIRVTPWRGLVVPGLTQAKAPGLLTSLADAGFVTSTASAWHGAGACAGRPGCAKSRADVRADAAAALGRRRSAGLLPVYWSGCERRCGHPGGRWVDVLATGDGYEVTERDGTWSGPARRVTSAGPEGPADAVAAARSGARTRTTIQQ